MALASHGPGASVRDGEAWEASMRETVSAMFYGDSVMAHVLRARCPA
jgi:hypothetical protein